MDRLLFQTYDAETPFNTLVFTVFQFRIQRWLRGIGHPHGCRGGVVDTALYDSQINDPLIRANLFVLAMSDCNLLPGDPCDRYIVSLHCIMHNETELDILQVNLSRAAASDAVGNGPTVFLHVCFLSVDIYITEVLLEMLLEDSHLDDGKTTRFDIWWHSIIVQKGYNRV